MQEDIALESRRTLTSMISLDRKLFPEAEPQALQDPIDRRLNSFRYRRGQPGKRKRLRSAEDVLLAVIDAKTSEEAANIITKHRAKLEYYIENRINETEAWQVWQATEEKGRARTEAFKCLEDFNSQIASATTGPVRVLCWLTYMVCICERLSKFLTIKVALRR
jgi:hypothetical protein